MDNGVASSAAEVAHELNGAVRALLGLRQPGRPSTVARFEAQVREWLGPEPMLSGAELLRRARLVGYQGGQGALYELVRRIRLTTSRQDGPPTDGAGAGAVVAVFV